MNRIPARYLFFALSLMILAGCSSAPRPEQLAADSALAVAQNALGGRSNEHASILFHKALGLEALVGRPGPKAQAYEALALLSAQRADFDSAFSYYETARALYRELTDRPGARRITIEIARLHRLMGEEETAYDQLEEALRLARVYSDSTGIRELAMEILASCRVLERRDVETRAVKEVYRAFARPGEEKSLARLYSELGETALFRQQFDLATSHFQKANALAAQGGDSLFAARSMLRMGIAFSGGGKIAEAFQAYNNSLRQADRTASAAGIRSELLLRVGNAYAKSRQLDQARRFYNMALTSAVKAGNTLAEGYISLQLAMCGVSTDPNAAVNDIRQVVGLFKERGYSRGLSYAELCLGAALEKGVRLTDAIAAYRSAATDLEEAWSFRKDDLYTECEGVFFTPQRGAPYHRLLDLLLRTGQFDQAFGAAQRKQGWEYRRVYGGIPLRTNETTAGDELTALSRAINRRIGSEEQMARLLEHSSGDRGLAAALKKALGETSAEASVRGTELLRRTPEAAPFVSIAPMAIPDLQRRIGPGSALIWYVPTDRSLYQYIVTPQRVSIQFAAIERGTLMSMLSTLDGALRRTQARGDSISKIIALPDGTVLETLRKLHEAFVRPGESDIVSVDRLLLVLPRDLGFIPVHALRKSTFPGTKYLGEEKIVTYIPGGAWCVDPSREWKNSGQTIVGMGYAGNSGWDVEYELRDIQAFFKEAKLFFGDAVGMDAVQSKKGDLLHIAAEFRAAAGAPWSASVILSGPRNAGVPAIIPASTFSAGVHFPAVIISNLEPDQPGIPSIVAPLLLSGDGRAVITNAYTPSRKLKKVFGEAFYTGLLSGATPPQAYRGALRELIRNPEFSSPLVWGTFQLWGE